MKIILHCFICMLFLTELNGQITVPSAPPKRVQNKPAPVIENRASVNVSWQGEGTVIIRLDDKEITLGSGQHTMVSLRTGKGLEIYVQIPGKKFYPKEFLIINESGGDLDIGLADEVVTLFYETPGEKRLREEAEEQERQRQELEARQQREEAARKEQQRIERLQQEREREARERELAAQRARQQQREREEYLERQRAIEREEAEKRRIAAEQEAARLRVSGAMNSDDGPYFKYEFAYLSYNKLVSIRNNALSNTLGVWWPLGGRLFFLDTDFNWGFGLKTNTNSLYSNFGSNSYSITSTGTGGGFAGGGIGLQIALVNSYVDDFTWLIGSNFCMNYNFMPDIKINEKYTTYASHSFNNYWEISTSFAFKSVYFKVMMGFPRNSVDGNLHFTDNSTIYLPYSHADKFFGLGIGFK